MRLFNCFRFLLALVVITGIIFPGFGQAQVAADPDTESSGVPYHHQGSSPYAHLNSGLEDETAKRLVLLAATLGSLGLILVGVSLSPRLSRFSIFQERRTDGAKNLELEDEHLSKENV